MQYLRDMKEKIARKMNSEVTREQLNLCLGVGAFTGSTIAVYTSESNAIRNCNNTAINLIHTGVAVVMGHMLNRHEQGNT